MEERQNVSKRLAKSSFNPPGTSKLAKAAAVTPGPFLMGEKFTAADIVIGSNIRWGMMFKMLPERKEFIDYVARFSDRPAAKRAQAKDEQLAKA